MNKAYFHNTYISDVEIELYDSNKKMKKGLVFMQLLGAVCNWEGDRYWLKQDEKERHEGIKTGGIKLCKKGYNGFRI